MEENLRIIKPFIRGFFLIVLSMILSVMAAKKYLSYVVPMYDSTTKLKLADVREGLQNSNLFKDFDVFASSNKIAAEIEVLKSNILINKALDSLDFGVEIYRTGKLKSAELYDNSPIEIKGQFTNVKGFDKRHRLTITTKNKFEIQWNSINDNEVIKGEFGIPVIFEGGEMVVSLDSVYLSHKPDANLLDVYEFEFLSRQKLVQKIMKNLDVVSVDKDVAVIRINYKSPVPEKASLFVNRLAKTYIQDYIEEKYKAAETTVDFLDKQLVDVSRKLSKSERNIEDYRNTEGITNIRQETETDLRKISQLRIQQTNVKMNLLAIQSLEKYIQNGKDNFLELAPNFEAFTDLLSTEIIKSLKSLQSEKKDLLLIYTADEEKVKVIDAKIEDLKSYLIESISNTAKNLEIKYQNLSKDIEEFEKVFQTIPEKEKMLTLMNREFEIYEKTYITLNEKRIEAKIAKAAKIAFHRIISPAKPSEAPVSPNKTIIIIVSALLGMFGSIALIYLVHMLKAKVNDKYTIESLSTIPIALLTPKLRSEKTIDNHFLKKIGHLEMKKIIQDKVKICFTSFDNREGSYFNCIHFAQALARQDRKVLLVDVEGILNMKSDSNASPVSIQENLDGVNMSHTNFNYYTKARLNSYLENLRSPYDVTLVLNESFGQQKSILFMGLADTNLVSVDARLTPAKRVVEVELLRDEYHIPNVHFILNRFKYNPTVIQEVFILFKKLFFKKSKVGNGLIQYPITSN